MRDYLKETESRVEFIRGVLRDAGARGIVFGNSGGKDAALCGILCKLACRDTVGMIMPCGSKRNYGQDAVDAQAVAGQYGIETRTVDLGGVFDKLRLEISIAADLTETSAANIAPRLRMTVLYAIAASENRLVAGTGNKSERYMGYFTKWGDGAFDFNPIADLTVREVYEFLKHLDAPNAIIQKAPSAGLFDGQTDEEEMGVSYNSIDSFLLDGICAAEDLQIIERYHSIGRHKLHLPICYCPDKQQI